MSTEIKIKDCELSGSVNAKLEVSGKHAGTVEVLFDLLTKRQVGTIDSDTINAYRAIFPESKLEGVKRAGERVTLRWTANVDGKERPFHATATVQALDTRVAYWIAITNVSRENDFVGVEVVSDDGLKSARGRKAVVKNYASAI
jgi:hypothetical protein